MAKKGPIIYKSEGTRFAFLKCLHAYQFECIVLSFSKNVFGDV